ncbi:hypothetical protein Tco_0340462 [Tanacetum coccineum]
MHIFNGIRDGEKKIAWVSWSKVLASKSNGGLGVSSFYALNRGLLFKWIWRFLSRDQSLWAQVIHALHGSNTSTLSASYSSLWSSIIKECNALKSQGLDLISHCKIRVGNVFVGCFDDMLLPKSDVPTRWVMQIPFKVMFCMEDLIWDRFLSVNLHRRGVQAIVKCIEFVVFNQLIDAPLSNSRVYGVKVNQKHCCCMWMDTSHMEEIVVVVATSVGTSFFIVTVCSRLV